MGWGAGAALLSVIPAMLHGPPFLPVPIPLEMLMVSFWEDLGAETLQ